MDLNMHPTQEHGVNGDKFDTRENRSFHGGEGSSWGRVVTPSIEAGVSKILRNAGTLPQYHTASQPRRPRLESRYIILWI